MNDAIRAMLRDGEAQLAFDAATRWLTQAPDSAEAHFLAGIAAAMLGKVTRGIALIEAAASERAACSSRRTNV
jgi:hypothetical protein